MPQWFYIKIRKQIFCEWWLVGYETLSSGLVHANFIVTPDSIQYIQTPPWHLTAFSTCKSHHDAWRCSVHANPTVTPDGVQYIQTPLWHLMAFSTSKPHHDTWWRSVHANPTVVPDSVQYMQIPPWCLMAFSTCKSHRDAWWRSVHPHPTNNHSWTFKHFFFKKHTKSTGHLKTKSLNLGFILVFYMSCEGWFLYGIHTILQSYNLTK